MKFLDHAQYFQVISGFAVISMCTFRSLLVHWMISYTLQCPLSLFICIHFAGFTASYSFVFPFPKRMWPFQCCFVPDCLFTVTQYFKQSLSHWLTHLYHKYQLLLWEVTVPWRSQNCHQYNSHLQDWKNYSHQCLLGINWTFQWSWYQCLMSYRQT